MLPLLTATLFLKVMGSDRTQPCLMACENAQGEEVEAVVKLRGPPQIFDSEISAKEPNWRRGLDKKFPWWKLFIELPSR